jgi:hypothetical protein
MPSKRLTVLYTLAAAVILLYAVAMAAPYCLDRGLPLPTP